jgi:hypothetical protein
MASVRQKAASEDLLEPFFTDERTIADKLAATEREWRPHQPEHDCPPIIAGLVLELGEYFSEYSEEPAPTLRVLDRDNTVWSVVGFHGRLRWEVKKTAPRVGDFTAIAYRGVIASKKKGMNDAHDYAVAVERNPDAVVIEQNERGNDQLAGSTPAQPLPPDDEILDETAEGTAEEAGDGIPF